MAAASLTILVPTNDRPDVIARVWSSWLEQEGLAQIVIVDDGSVYDYEPVFSDIRHAARRHGVDLRVIRLPRRYGASAARNAGLQACTGDEILTLDDDILLTPSLVSECRRARPSSACPVIVGPRVVYLRDGESEAAAETRSRADARPYFDAKTLTLVPWVRPDGVQRVPFVTAVAIWPRRLFDEGLRYFEGYGGNGYREETDPQLQAQAGHKAEVYFIPSATVFHLPPGIAYRRRSGQRRYHPLHFEWHVARNNAVFLRRHSTFLASHFAVKPGLSWLALVRSRLSISRLHAWAERRVGVLARGAR